MAKNKPSIILFSLAGLLYLVSALTENEYLALLTKPIIIPAIFVYYFIESRGKINNLFVFSLFSFFVGDMLYLVNIKDYYLLGLVIYLSPYLIVLGFLIQDIINLLKRKTINKSDLSFLIILFFLVYLMISLLNVLDTESDEEFVYFLLFGVELVLMGVFATLLYVNENSRVNFFLIISVSLFIISDIFFILNKNLFPLLIFKIGNVSSQIISYYFYTRYFIEKQKQLK
ncbi:lysoplasmalogenase family protein [Flavobacterium sp.]|uniref:lysoplasmalogenase family protein n=1 Tax=Flavobacterium sp. TaxID=239 RepID=UPI003D28D1D1